MSDQILNIFNSWGPPGSLALVMWVMLGRSEKREAAKDLRIQLLENNLIESYDERVAIANQVAEAMHANAIALTALTNEIRSRPHA